VKSKTTAVYYCIKYMAIVNFTITKLALRSIYAH